MVNPRQNILNLVMGLLQRKGMSEVSPEETGLTSKGYLDSVDIMEIIVLLEKEYGLDFRYRGFDQSEFDSIDNIIQLIKEMKNVHD